MRAVPAGKGVPYLWLQPVSSVLLLRKCPRACTAALTEKRLAATYELTYLPCLLALTLTLTLALALALPLTLTS